MPARGIRIDGKVVRPFLQELKARVLEKYEPLRYTGNFKNVFFFRVNTGYNKIRIGLNQPNYTQYIIPEGRPAGPVPYQIILDWVRAKPITPRDDISQESLAWAIKRKIELDGIDVPNRFNKGNLLEPISEFVDSGEVNEMIDAVASNIRDQIVRNFQKTIDDSNTAKQYPTKKRTRPARRVRTRAKNAS